LSPQEFQAVIAAVTFSVMPGLVPGIHVFA
jgi:hypothetical protein